MTGHGLRGTEGTFFYDFIPAEATPLPHAHWQEAQAGCCKLQGSLPFIP